MYTIQTCVQVVLIIHVIVRTLISTSGGDGVLSFMIASPCDHSNRRNRLQRKGNDNYAVGQLSNDPIQQRYSRSGRPRNHPISRNPRLYSSVSAEETFYVLDVVLFGLGDYRVEDHDGLSSALLAASHFEATLSPNEKTQRNVILPLTILETVNTLPNFPSRSHLLDTASLLASCLNSLDHQLDLKYGLNLHVHHKVGNDSRRSRDSRVQHEDALPRLLQEVINTTVEEYHDKYPFQKVRVHVCDLGPADNSIGYSPYPYLQQLKSNTTITHHGIPIQICPWTCQINTLAWTQVTSDPNTFPARFDEYENQHRAFLQRNDRSEIVTAPNNLKTIVPSKDNIVSATVPSLMNIPSVDQIKHLLLTSQKKDSCPTQVETILSSSNNSTATSSNVTSDDSYTLQNQNTGLYGTHWGGIDIPSTMTEDHVHGCIDSFLGRRKRSSRDSGDNVFRKNNHYGDDALLIEYPTMFTSLRRNPGSLEHAAIHRMMKHSSTDDYHTDNLIEGELLTRFLAAPLLFGVVSHRYLWYKAQEYKVRSPEQEWQLPWVRLQQSAQEEKSFNLMKSLAINREWHMLLAAKNILTSNHTKNPSTINKDCIEKIKYWRWHGFLCRYIVYLKPGNTTLLDDNSLSSSVTTGNILSPTNHQSRNGVVFVHGFGASGTQFSKCIYELLRGLYESVPPAVVGTDAFNSRGNISKGVNDSGGYIATAPDLIGFGESEKPSFTYTQYLWEAFVAAFVKEVVTDANQLRIDKFVIGGNSIGGYTAMAVAADDHSPPSEGLSQSTLVSSSAARGTQKCKGLVLMNSAGRIYSREDLEELSSSQISGLSVAEATALDLLGPVKSPPRIVVSLGAALILSYLRPRIRSICKSLYPTNPETLETSSVCSDILRDSLDPGAVNVMISGSKLPPPRSANELLGADFGSTSHRQYTTFNVGSNSQQLSSVREGSFVGPVLIAQGILDPLNDAKGRAKLFGSLRKDIEVQEIEGGHCPHDELPSITANKILLWLSHRNPFRY